MLYYRELKVTLDGSDDNYLPRKLVVEGGEPNNFTVLNTVNITWYVQVFIGHLQDILWDIEKLLNHYSMNSQIGNQTTFKKKYS